MRNLILRNPSKVMTVAAILLVAMFMVVPAYAQLDSIPTDVQAPSSVGGLLGIVEAIFNILFIALMLFAGIFIILAAFSYLTAGGDAEKIQAANKKVIYAAVAVAVAIFAKAIPFIVADFIGNPGDVTA